jgi:hypothetical protein
MRLPVEFSTGVTLVNEILEQKRIHFPVLVVKSVNYALYFVTYGPFLSND